MDYLFPFEEIDQGEKHLAAQLLLPPEFPFFQGHFPQNPVLPAVSIIDASLELLKRKFPELSMSNIKLKRCRFTSTIRPNERVFVEAQNDKEKSWKFSWHDRERKTVMAQVNILL